MFSGCRGRNEAASASGLEPPHRVWWCPPHLQIPVDELTGVDVLNSTDYLCENRETFLFPPLVLILILFIYPFPEGFSGTQLHLDVKVLER